MSENNEQPKKQKIDDAEFQRLAMLVNAAVSAAMKEGRESSEQTTKMIVEGLLEARKPYVDPKQLANEESMRQSMREQAKRDRSITQAEQESCPHVKGSSPLSFRSDPFDSAIAKHLLDTGEVIGICTNCTRIFSSLNQEDHKWLNMKSSNQMSTAGRRTFNDPVTVMKARLGPKEEIFIEEAVAK